MKKIFFVFALIICGLAIFPLKNYAWDKTDQEFKLYLGEVKVITVNNPFRIVIGDPQIVDVSNVTKDSLTLNPKAAGMTNLVFWDNFGENSYRIKVISENVPENKIRADNLLKKLNLPEVYTSAAEDEGKVLLLGRVKKSQDIERINTALGTLKDKFVDLIQVKEEESMVEIDVQVLELNKDATNTLGFTWPGSVTLTEEDSPALAARGSKWSTLFKVVSLSRDAFEWTLDALVQEGKARILSRPRLACQSGKEAELSVGGEKPILTTEVASGGGEGTNVSYKEYGIKLNIKPTTNEDGRIKLVLNVEVSEVEDAVVLGTDTSPTAKAYPLVKRSASTEVVVNDRQTLAIGGLIKEKTEEDIRKVPFLGDIPGIGLLFRKKTSSIGGGSTERGNTELFITLTPTIMEKENSQEIKKDTGNKIIEIPISSNKNMPLTPLQEYTATIQKQILSNLKYPLYAAEAGFQGTVKLNLHLSFLGELLDVSIKSSSGYRDLDNDALLLVKGILSYPHFPSSIKQEELWIEIPIVYSLE